MSGVGEMNHDPKQGEAEGTIPRGLNKWGGRLTVIPADPGAHIQGRPAKVVIKWPLPRAFNNTVKS